MDAVMDGSREELLAKVPTLNWAHSIDLGGGVVSPGAWGLETQGHIREALDAVDFRGAKVLDIGCWDGLWSFEAERRGAAEVVATDDVRQRVHAHDPTFALARTLLGSKARYHPDVPVAEVGRLGIRDFDVVLFNGIYYHLRDPLLAFARLRRVMKDGARIVVEGEVKAGDDCSAEFSYQSYYLHPSNWWIPTVPCLRQWITSSFFEIEREVVGPGEPLTRYGRYVVVARAVRRNDPLYWGVDDDLEEFMLR